jgi:hypothetical protein
MELQLKISDNPQPLNLEPLNPQPTKKKALPIKQSLLFKQ